MSSQSRHITYLLFSKLVTCYYHKQFQVSLYAVWGWSMTYWNIQQNLRNFYRFQSERRFLATEASATPLYASVSGCGFRTSQSAFRYRSSAARPERSSSEKLAPSCFCTDFGQATRIHRASGSFLSSNASDSQLSVELITLPTLVNVCLNFSCSLLT